MITKNRVQQKLAHEVREFFIVFLFLAPFLTSFTFYRMYLLHEQADYSFEFGTELVNALILSKIILIGQAAGLGKRFDDKALILSTIYKAAVFSIFYTAFHLVESSLISWMHGHTLLTSIEKELTEQQGVHVSRSLFFFSAFVPFFGFLEIRRVLGDKALKQLFLGDHKIISASGQPPASS
jgi:hypothetical protein